MLHKKCLNGTKLYTCSFLFEKRKSSSIENNLICDLEVRKLIDNMIHLTYLSFQRLMENKLVAHNLTISSLKSSCDQQIRMDCNSDKLAA